jgi:hypothetical protein
LPNRFLPAPEATVLESDIHQHPLQARDLSGNAMQQ